MEDNLKRIANRFVSFSFGPLISAIISFIIVPITTYLVTPQEFGKAAMYIVAYTLCSLIIFLGLDQSFLREYHSSNSKYKLFSSAVFLPLFFAVILSTLFLAFYKQLSFFLFNEINLKVVTYLSLSLILAIINRFSLLIYRIQEKAKLYSTYIILNKLLEGILIVIIIYFQQEKTFIGIIQSTFISLLIVTTIQFINTYKYWIKILDIDKILLKKLISFGLPLVPATILVWIFSTVDRLALKSWSTYTELGIYTSAFKIVAILSIFQQAFATFWIPTAYRWFEKGVPNERFEKVGNLLILYMGFIFILVIAFKDLIIVILGDSYTTAAICVPFLLFSPLMYTLSECTSLGISFKRKTKYNILISASVAIINVFGNILLVPKFGALGASMSTGLSYISFFWLRTIISRRIWYKFKIKLYAINTVLFIIVSITTLFSNNLLIYIFYMFLLTFINREALKYSFYLLGFFKNQRSKDKINI